MAVLELILNTGQIIHVPYTATTVVTVDNGPDGQRAAVTDVASVASLGADVPAKPEPVAEPEPAPAPQPAAKPKAKSKEKKS